MNSQNYRIWSTENRHNLFCTALQLLKIRIGFAMSYRQYKCTKLFTTDVTARTTLQYTEELVTD